MRRTLRSNEALQNQLEITSFLQAPREPWKDVVKHGEDSQHKKKTKTGGIHYHPQGDCKKRAKLPTPYSGASLSLKDALRIIRLPYSYFSTDKKRST